MITIKNCLITLMSINNIFSCKLSVKVYIMSSNNLTTIPLSDPSRELDYINRYNSRLTREVRSGNYIGGSSVQKLEEKLCSF